MDHDRAKYSKIKDISDITGHSGPWQMRTVTIFMFICFSGSWHNLILAFQAPNIQYWCKQSENNVTNSMTSERYQCYDGDQKCTSWIYDNTIFHNTITSEWNLVCDREWLASLAKSSYMVGHLFSSVLFGQLSDRIGRRPVILLCYTLFWISAMVTIFADSIVTFLFLRFMMALGLSSAFTTAFVTVMEVMGSELRPVYGVSSKIGWNLGYLTLPAVAWFVRDWRHLQFAITLPWVSMAVMWWFLEESPRWLLIAGQEDRAEAILLRACKRNGKSLEEVHAPLRKLCSRSLKEKESSNKESFLDILKYPSLRKSTAYQFFIWFSFALVYYALTWGTNDLEGDPFWNFFLAALVEVPARLLAVYMVVYYDRRRPVANASFVAGAILICYSCTMSWEDVGHKLFCFMMAKFCISIAFTLMYMYSSELFPTIVRGLGVGCCSTSARVGAILAPFMLHIGGDSLPSLSYWIYGLLCVSSGFCTLLLPETSKRKLADTLEEGEAFHRSGVIIV